MPRVGLVIRIPSPAPEEIIELHGRNPMPFAIQGFFYLLGRMERTGPDLHLLL